jgi:hypothetical protein
VAKGTERQRRCVECGITFTGRYRKCPGCRPYRIERQCTQCGSAFRGETLKCSACLAIKRQCITCGMTFTGRYRNCDSCRSPEPNPCQIPGCDKPKAPGYGSKLCQEHRDSAYQRKLERLRKKTQEPCRMPDCPDLKLPGAFRYCAVHSAEGPQRERAQVVRRARERAYGITHDEYETLLEVQGGACAICGNGEQKRALAVDHDHQTGTIRGLLCDRCNPMLGYAQDNAAILQAAITYLTKTGAKY